jgi:GNAT superfamily N-acetyltransferase
MAAPAWRPMHAGDLRDVERIGAIVHPRYPEREEVPAERLRLFPAGCLMAVRGGAAIGYAIAHPGVIGHPPALDILLGALPGNADCLYIHDVALLPEARGSRLGASATAYLAGVARDHGLRRLALTAVNDSAAFWSRQGFSAVQIDKDLASYGADAAYMARTL